MSDIIFKFGADIRGVINAFADIRQTVNQYSSNISSNFQSVNQTLNETRNKFVTINNTLADAKDKWTEFANKTQVIRNSFRILTAAASTLKNALSAPLAQFSRYEDAAQRLAPLVGGMEKAKAIADKLRDSAANGTMSLEQLTGVAGRLASVFRSGDDVLKWTEAFHNLSAGTGLDVNELLGNFTKAKASGRFEAGFMDMFAQKGVNLYAPLATELGMSEAALRAAEKASSSVAGATLISREGPAFFSSSGR